MKKIFTFIIAMVMTITLAVAQNKTVEYSKWYENTSVTVLGGVTTTGQMMDVPTPFFWDGTKAVFSGVKPVMGLELTKYFTPVVGVSVEGLGFIGTTTSKTFFDESALLANGKVNISNLFGYKGQPRRVEVVAVAGLGWGHDYVNRDIQAWGSTPPESISEFPGREVVVGVNPYNTNAVLFTDKNYVVYNAAAELNVNLGKDRDWQVSVRPGVLWFNKYTAGHFQSLPTWKHDARANVQVGVTYKFGKAGKKNFRLCPYSVTQKDYDALKKQYNDLANREPEVFKVVKRVTETKEVVKTETKVLVGTTVITFPIGSCALSNVERQKVALFAETFKDDDTLIKLVGSADSKTGSETRNFALAQNRANVVRNVLVNDYGINADRITVETELDVLNDAEATRCVLATVK